MHESEFATAIGQLEPSMGHPRFGIYRNNVASALTNSLRVSYPVVEQLVGPEFFGAMARDFIKGHKPNSAMLISYGAEFPEFISNFEHAASLPYLAYVAQLESAWWVAYHAADSIPLGREILAALAPDAWAETHLRFLQNTSLLKFEYAAVSIWRAHQDGGSAASLQVTSAEQALVCRDGHQVMVHGLTKDMYHFLNVIADGGTLLDAFEFASDFNAEFDVIAAVQQLFQFNMIGELY